MYFNKSIYLIIKFQHKNQLPNYCYHLFNKNIFPQMQFQKNIALLDYSFKLQLL
jgi:hypothetical protein